MGAERHYDALVIGAGITGLASARLFARAGLRTCLLEAESRVGGALHSAHIALARHDYWLELGAHTLFNTYGTLLTEFPEAELAHKVVRRRRLPFLLWHAGKAESIVAALHWGELLRNLPTVLRRQRAGTRTGEWFGAVAGRRNYAEVIGPSIDALLCQSAAEFPADLLFKRRPRNTTFPRSFSLQGGVGALVHALAHGFELRTSTPALHLARHGAALLCETPAGDFSAPRLLLAVPVAEAARLLAPLAPALAAPLAMTPVAELESTAVVLRAEEVALPPLAGMVARDAPWYSMVSRDVIPDPATRGFTFHFRPGLAPAERVRVAAQVLRVRPEAFIATLHANHRLPGLRLGHEARIERLDHGLSGLPVGVAGNWFTGLGIEECVARARRETRRLLDLPVGT